MALVLLGILYTAIGSAALAKMLPFSVSTAEILWFDFASVWLGTLVYGSTGITAFSSGSVGFTFGSQWP